MNLLLISNSTNAGEPYLKYPIGEIAKTLQGVKEVVFIPYAAITFSYDEYERKVQERFNEIGIKVNSIHHAINKRNFITVMFKCACNARPSRTLIWNSKTLTNHPFTYWFWCQIFIFFLLNDKVRTSTTSTTIAGER